MSTKCIVVHSVISLSSDPLSMNTQPSVPAIKTATGDKCFPRYVDITILVLTDFHKYYM